MAPTIAVITAIRLTAATRSPSVVAKTEATRHRVIAVTSVVAEPAITAHSGIRHLEATVAQVEPLIALQVAAIAAVDITDPLGVIEAVVPTIEAAVATVAA